MELQARFHDVGVSAVVSLWGAVQGRDERDAGLLTLGETIRAASSRARHTIFLLERGGNPNAADKNGITALHNLLRYRGQYGSHDSTAKLLLSLGAKPFTQDELDARAAAR